MSRESDFCLIPIGVDNEPNCLDNDLLKEVVSVKEATKGVHHLSWVCDKLQTGHFGLVNTTLGLPDNHAEVLVPQVASTCHLPLQEWPYLP